MPENLLSIEPRSAGVPYFCNHEAVTLNEHDRAVNCSRCGATLEPFNFLMSNARTIQMAWSNYREAQRKVSELNERIAVLAKEEKRLRAQVKRLQDKTGGVLNLRVGDEL
ncbi:MAG TPA: hypothetical protein VFP33_06105 [Gallionella sp.]|nr:hypothetical protein [Gallionella sp.]